MKITNRQLRRIIKEALAESRVEKRFPGAIDALREIVDEINNDPDYGEPIDFTAIEFSIVAGALHAESSEYDVHWEYEKDDAGIMTWQG